MAPGTILTAKSPGSRPATMESSPQASTQRPRLRDSPCSQGTSLASSLGSRLTFKDYGFKAPLEQASPKLQWTQYSPHTNTSWCQADSYRLGLQELIRSGTASSSSGPAPAPCQPHPMDSGIRPDPVDPDDKTIKTNTYLLCLNDHCAL